ncbi:MAG TPA: hypothetical protein VH879_06975 [Gemmatimonadales bacterium]|jgi:hypothetical protein
MAALGIVRSEPDLSDSVHPFRERLAETVSWCQRRAEQGDLKDALRTAELAPPPASSWHETVRAVAEARVQRLGRSWRRSLEPLGGGQLVLYFPTPPHSRGRARSASAGYFDDRDIPPWDTWIAYIEEPARSYLVCWVPPQATEAVTEALKLSRALRWFEGSGVGLEDQLRD